MGVVAPQTQRGGGGGGGDASPGNGVIRSPRVHIETNGTLKINNGSDCFSTDAGFCHKQHYRLGLTLTLCCVCSPQKFCNGSESTD